MSFRISHCILIGTSVLWLTTASAVADDVASYLERHGLTQLLALHLEEELASASAEDQALLAMRLAEIYAGLLETTDDVSLRVDLESRSRKLLELVPEENADELRFALLRGGYTAAERIAENHRLRLSNEEEVERAREILRDAIPNFNTLRKQIEKRVEVTKRRRGRATGADAARLTEQLNKLRSLGTRATFLSAWAMYYLSWLNGEADHARLAIRLFGRILDPELSRVTIADVSLDLLATESFARTVLGMALAKSLVSGADEGLRWLALLDTEKANSTIKEQVPAWRLAVLLEHDEFREAARQLELLTRSEEEIPVAWIRLAAAYALEESQADTNAAALARFAIGELAARGDLDQVLDLAERFGTESIGDTGFAALYVTGARHYQKARERHNDDSPTADPELAALYQNAAEAFEQAVRESDASEFAGAAAEAQSLIGWCYYFQGRFFEARQAFETAADALPNSEAPESMWMAIVSLDRVARTGDDPDLTAELSTLIDRFLARYPSSEYVPQLILRQSQATPSLERVEKLLSIPLESDTFVVAQRNAAQMLFQLFEQASGNRRIEIGDRYLNLAFPMWLQTEADGMGDDSDLRKAFLIRARRILLVALTPGIERRRAADETLARLDDLIRSGTIDASGFEDELLYRRFQQGMLSEDSAAAERFADELWERDDTSSWSIAAVRRLFQHAARAWRQAGSDPRDLLMLKRIVRYGGRTLHEFESKNSTLDDPAVLASYTTVAEAAQLVWEESGSDAEGEQALYLFEKLLGQRPNNERFLHAVGTLGPHFNHTDEAVEAWRTLSAGTTQGTEAWYEAKYHLIRLRLETDPVHARAVMDQFKALYPDLGPQPWSERFRALDEQIDRAVTDGGFNASSVEEQH